MTYHVTYFYLATGMDGIPDKEDYGIVTADTEDMAKEIAAKNRHPKMSRQDLDWVKGCLSVRRIRQ